MNVAHWDLEHARCFGDSIGLIAAGRQWTNRELCDDAARLASALLSMGVEPGDRVVIALPNCAELFVAVSGVLMAGAVFVALSESAGQEIERCAAHCSAKVAILSAQAARALGANALACKVQVDGARPQGGALFDELLLGRKPLSSPVPRGSRDVAQISYTSGTTGRPKGVIYTHGGGAALLRYARAELIPSRAVLLLAAPPTAFGCNFIRMRVVADATCVVLQTFQPHSTLAAIEEHRVTDMPLVPTMAEQLVAHGCASPDRCRSLRSISLGGAHVSSNLIRRLKRLFVQGTAGEDDVPVPSKETESSLSVVVHYGSTEAGGGFVRTEAGGDGVVGHVVPDVTVRIVDGETNEVPMGELGEIIVRSPYAAAGYWNDPEQTATVFRDGFVYTGDLGKFQRDGQLRVVGRTRELINQGGNKIVPSEIADIVASMVGVCECAVVGVPNDLLGEEAVLCVVKAAGSRIDEQSVRARCRSVLQPAKMPVRILICDSLPKSGNGKLDIVRIREDLTARARGMSLDERAPRTPQQTQHAATYTEVLQVLCRLVRHSGGRVPEHEAPIADATWEELGLDSLGIVRLAHAAHDEFGLSVSPTYVYAAAGVGKLSDSIAEQLRAGTVRTSFTRKAEWDAIGEEEIALVGLGCRVPPNINTPAGLWELLRDGRDAIHSAPAQRQSSDTSWRGSFLSNVDEFDAAFFRLAAQAAQIDPRHRMVLEVAWEALENAGCDPRALASARTGVFLGLYGERYPSDDPLGTAPSMAAARLCQFLDITGPVVTIDTTCSSSLVALHYAARSLRARDCDIAIVGGANLLTEPQGDSPSGFMAPDGRTKAFAASADGFGQGEGCILLVLRRLRDAQRNGDRVYATVLGTAINHDGRSSSLTAPNPRSQAEVIRLAIAASRITLDCIQYVEAHGTGTALGDPLEVEGLAQAFRDRATPLPIGSVKTNIGHLEAAAGVAGIAKAALAIFHRYLPASLHCAVPSERIPWDALPISVHTRAGDWPRPEERLIAGVSSFGLSGTNAHAIIAECSGSAAQCSAPFADPQEDGSPWILTLSAMTPRSLRANAARVLEWLENCAGQNACRDIAYTLSCRRPRFSHRLAIVGHTAQDWVAGLSEYLANGNATAGGNKQQQPRKIALLFSGQGAQYCGMGQELYRKYIVFRHTMDECDRVARQHVDWRLLEELQRDEATSRLTQTEVAQPAILAIQIALYELLRSWKIIPVAIAGHSLGELAAAYAAGHLSLEQAVRVACLRGRTVQRTAGEGAMAAVALSAVAARELCCDAGGRIEIAAINAPRATVLSGDAVTVHRVLNDVRLRNVDCKLLATRHAFHSQAMRAAAEQLAAAISDLDEHLRAPRIPLVSSLTGTMAPQMNPSYWCRQLWQPVRFADAVETLIGEGCDTFIEIGPHPALLQAVHAIAEDGQRAESIAAVGSLRRGRPEADGLAHMLEELYHRGIDVDWGARFPAGCRVVDAPTYQWDHASYWSDAGCRNPRQERAAIVGSVVSESGAQDIDQAPSELSVSKVSRVEEIRQFLTQQMARLAQIGIDDLRATDTLDSLGIDSLAMMQMCLMLHRRFGLRVATGLLTPNSTVDVVTTTVLSIESRGGAAGAPAASPFYWLRPDGEMPTVIWVHPAGGGIACYRALAIDLPFKSGGLEAPGLRAEEPLPTSIEALATAYVAALDRSRGGSDRIVLAGWSLGGVIAFEMAAQLVSAGAQVPAVIMIDSHLAETGGLATNVVYSFVRDVFAGEGSGAGLSIDPDRLVEVAAELGLEASLPRVLEQAGCRREVALEELERMFAVYRANLEILEHYRPPRHDGRVLMIRATESSEDADRGWRSAARCLDVRRVRADHYSIMGAGVRSQIATIVAEYVRATEHIT